MGTEWPRVARIDAAGLIEQVAAQSGLRLRLLGPLSGGEVGAALVALPSGVRAVLSSWPGTSGARAAAVSELLTGLRSRGYPAPAYLAVVPCGAVTAIVQEWVDGAPAYEVSAQLIRGLLALNELQRGALAAPGGSVADLYLDRDGPGYCLHEPLRRHSGRTAVLLDRISEAGRASPANVFTGTDVVHGDFYPGNILVATGSPDVVAGVVDWTGAQAGNCGLDLVTLGFFLDFDAAAPAVRGLVRERIATEVDRAALLAFVAHMSLRQVDWAIRHYGPPETGRWIDIADDWFARASQ